MKNEVSLVDKTKIYEREKQKILDNCTSYEEYEQKIRELCKKLGV